MLGSRRLWILLLQLTQYAIKDDQINSVPYGPIIQRVITHYGPSSEFSGGQSAILEGHTKTLLLCYVGERVGERVCVCVCACVCDERETQRDRERTVVLKICTLTELIKKMWIFFMFPLLKIHYKSEKVLLYNTKYNSLRK